MAAGDNAFYIDVKKSFMYRALATTGNYGSLIDNGKTFNRTNSVAYSRKNHALRPGSDRRHELRSFRYGCARSRPQRQIEKIDGRRFDAHRFHPLKSRPN